MDCVKSFLYQALDGNARRIVEAGIAGGLTSLSISFASEYFVDSSEKVYVQIFKFKDLNSFDCEMPHLLSDLLETVLIFVPSLAK